MKKLLKYFFVAVVLAFVVTGLAGQAQAYVIQDLSNVPVKNDFVLGPGKTELFLNPGDSVTKNLYITNRLGREVDIVVSVEDFVGSHDPNEVVRLLGNKRGPYSLKDYLHPELNRFTLGHGQKMVLPVEIKIPEDAEPGGLYGAVLVAAQPPQGGRRVEEGKVAGGAKIVTRLGTLFFIRIKGDISEEGQLRSFGIKAGKSFFEKSPIPFEILFENSGNVHLMPYGKIEFYNILGKQVDLMELEPWFAMPDSLRSRAVEWKKGFLIGKYTAKLKLNRGYGNLADEAETSFWVVPWKMILISFGGVVLLLLILKWLSSFVHIEFGRKKIETNTEQKR